MFYGTWDVTVSLMVAFFVNAAILVTAAGASAAQRRSGLDCLLLKASVISGGRREVYEATSMRCALACHSRQPRGDAVLTFHAAGAFHYGPNPNTGVQYITDAYRLLAPAVRAPLSPSCSQVA